MIVRLGTEHGIVRRKLIPRLALSSLCRLLETERHSIGIVRPRLKLPTIAASGETRDFGVGTEGITSGGRIGSGGDTLFEIDVDGVHLDEVFSEDEEESLGGQSGFVEVASEFEADADLAVGRGVGEDAFVAVTGLDGSDDARALWTSASQTKSGRRREHSRSN